MHISNFLDYKDFIQHIQHTYSDKWNNLAESIFNALRAPNGNWQKFLPAITNVVNIPSFTINYHQDVISLEPSANITATHKETILAALQLLKPWRKGPFKIADINLDTEWRCEYKWHRVKQLVGSFKNDTVLDIGAGNGYYAWRILADQPATVCAIEPSVLSIMQYQFIQTLIAKPVDNLAVLPLALENIPHGLNIFDKVLSMGVLYHRRSPIEHLAKIKQLLAPNGKLILETLVVDGIAGYSLMPKKTYAKMRNVWFIPSTATLQLWLERCGFKDIILGDTITTTAQEQRVTTWSSPLSLADCLNPHNSELTCEGYQAPQRVIIIASV